MNGEKKPLSFWHDISLLGDKRDEYNIVVEIPRYSPINIWIKIRFYLAKFEVSKEI
jgi:inorganic pyrophosphatase